MTTGSRPIATPTPLRGTQSLVGVMAFVWRHPSLTALEVLWRWLASVPMVFLVWRTLAPTLIAVPLDTAALGSMTFFEPVRSASVLAQQVRLYLPALEQTGKWWIPLAILVWALAAALGRNAILRRADTRWLPLSPRQSTQRTGFNLLSAALFTMLRALAFLLLLTLLAFVLLGAVRATILTPAHGGGDPNLVLLTAEVIALTLAAFMLWSLTIWALDLLSLRALTGLHVTTPGQHRELRSQLIETNLVMGIVRVALFVLAMTFSASPLPFQSHETQAYIDVWWTGVGVFYLLGSDFFHVVRRVTYLRLLQTTAVQTNVPASAAS